jgi:threonine synthase
MSKQITSWTLQCAACAVRYPGLDPRYRCDCGGTLDVVHDLSAVRVDAATFDARRASRNPLDRSGVWRFRELILPLGEDTLNECIVTRGEGNTQLYEASGIGRAIGVSRLQLKHEGENPTGSFKDRGMTAAISVAKHMGLKRVACASTGNTSASMASFAAIAGMQGVVFIPDGKIAYGKLCQALAYGAHTIQITGDFDDAMRLVQAVCAAEGIYLVNSVNPFRIEGQKAIGFEIMQDRAWRSPDWIVLPGGNLGNNTAIAKGLLELHSLGIIDRLPRMAVIQAAGANPLYTAWTTGAPIQPVVADTIASAIKIGAPVSWRKSLRGIAALDGVVTEVSDQEIMDAKALVDGAGIGAEPASCATVAGIRRLVAEGIIAPDAEVVGVLTGHLLKDPDAAVGYHTSKLEGIASNLANAPAKAPAELDAIRALLRP